MKVQIDFFKTSGKWYTSCEIDTPLEIWHEDFKQEIVNKQNGMMDGWQGDYFIVTSDTPQNELDNNYRGFYKRHFMPWDFNGISKKTIYP